MERLIRNPFFIIPVLILIISLALYVVFNKKQPTPKQEALTEQIVIEDSMRIIATPLAYLPKSQPRFKVELESFQNPDYTRLNLLESALLQTNTGKPLVPTSWDVIKEDEYRIEGILTFPETPVSYKKIRLTVFGLSEFVFEWDIP